MHICGIIAEYDPFHTGHARQIEAVRETLGEDCAVVCVMSGNWTQRGGPAIVDKRLRSRIALMGGADLVLELPLPYAISSAEWFARGGVSVLNATGIVTHICFGSECGNISVLQQAAACLDSEEYKHALRTHLEKGISFPTARQRAVDQLIGSAADCLSFPNNNLGVEYLRALAWCSSTITPITIHRYGAGHGEGPRDGFASSTHLRQRMKENRFDEILPFLIEGEAELLSDANVSDIKHAERAFLYQLRQMSEQDFDALPDCGEGLSNRLVRAIRQSTDIESILTQTKTKRYPLARLRRILTWAYLGLTAADRPDALPYIRVLGMNDTGRTLLRLMDTKASLPILTKPAHVNHLSDDAKHMFALDAHATDMYGLCFSLVPTCGTEWTQGPIIESKN